MCAMPFESVVTCGYLPCIGKWTSETFGAAIAAETQMRERRNTFMAPRLAGLRTFTMTKI